MSLMLQLPNAWLIMVLSEWLDLPSIGKLDTAVSSKKHRPQFLLSLQVMRSTTIDMFSCSPHRWLETRSWVASWWRWLSIRQIHVESIANLDANVHSHFAIPSMRKVETSSSFDDVCVHYLICNCPCLRSLKLQARVDRMSYLGLRILSTLHQSLEEFFLIGTFGEGRLEYYTQSALIDIFRQCTHLRKVSLTGDVWRDVKFEELLPFGHLFHELELRMGHRVGSYGQATSEFFAACSNLRNLQYGGRDNEEDCLALTTLSQSCVLLEDLLLEGFSFIEQEQQAHGANVNIFMNRNNCRHLRKLILVNCELSAPALQNIAGLETLLELEFRRCDGFTWADMSILATMKLFNLSIVSCHIDLLTESFVQSFVGSDISQTLESFSLVSYNAAPIDDVQFATALASCHKLTKLTVRSGSGKCRFGRSGLAGLEAMAAGCPLLADVSMQLTVGGIHYIGTHFGSLKKCIVSTTQAVMEGSPTPEQFPTVQDLHTLYPAVAWIIS